MTDVSGNTQSFKDNIVGIVDMLQPVAAGLGTLDALNGVREILETGSSAARQRAVVAQGAL